MNKKHKMLQQIQQYKFSINEINLFLDSHPTDKKALNKHYELTNKLQQTMTSYNKNWLFTAYDNVQQDEWQWSKTPWPWERNFKEEY